jgi:hypothetical protein
VVSAQPTRRQVLKAIVRRFTLYVNLGMIAMLAGSGLLELRKDDPSVFWMITAAFFIVVYLAWMRGIYRDTQKKLAGLPTCTCRGRFYE